MLDKCCVFGGIDESGSLLGVAVFQFFAAIGSRAKPLYLFVPAKYRGLGIEEQLLEGARKLFLEQGYLANEGGTNVNVLVYRHGQFNGANLIRLAGLKPDICSRMVRLDDYSSPLLSGFFRKYHGTEYFLSREEYDPLLCRFYIEKDSIKASLCLYRLPDGSIYNVRPFIALDIKLPNVMQYMAAELYSHIADRLEPDAMTCIHFRNRGLFGVCKGYVEGPTGEYGLNDYFK